MAKFPVKVLVGRLKKLLKKEYPTVRWVQDAVVDIRSLMLNASDIRGADEKSNNNCQGARCTKRFLPGKGVLFTSYIALVIEGVTATRYILSGAAHDIVTANDVERKGTVGKKFSLLAPKGSQLLGSKRTYTPPPNPTPKPRGEAVVAVLNGETIDIGGREEDRRRRTI
jgi:hypothetical protein